MCTIAARNRNANYSMLLTLHKIACRLLWCRPLAVLLACAGLAGIGVSLFAGKGSLGHLLEPSLVLTLWGMMLFSCLQLFRRIPPPVLPHDNFLTRLGGRIILALYTMLAFLVVVTTCMLVWVSVRLITLE
jgi:zinc transporter ZupT